jgi:glycosyltransferase involved in cell wall biosynthesis
MGGSEVYVAALAARLRAEGHAVRVIVPVAGLSAARTDEHDGVPVWRFPVPASPTRDEVDGGFTVRGGDAVAAWFADERPDWVHLHTISTGLGLPAVRAAREAGARVMVTFHTPGLGWVCPRGTLFRFDGVACDGAQTAATCARCALEARGLSPVLAMAASALPSAVTDVAATVPGPAGTLLGRRAMIERTWEHQAELGAAAECLVALTTVARDALLAHGASASRVRVNPLGSTIASGPRAMRVRGTGPLRFGFVGRFDVLKGAEDFAAAIELLPSSASCEFVFVGPSQDATSSVVRARIAALASRDARVVLRDAVPHAEIGALLASLDVLVCPSRCAEGGPTVALEAMAMGTPVIGSRIGGLLEIVRDGVDGALVTAGDPSALAAVLLRAVTDPSIVETWRASIQPVRTMRDVTSDYLAWYAA